MKKLLMALAILPLMAAAEVWIDPSTGIEWTYTLRGDGTVSLGIESTYTSHGDGTSWLDGSPYPVVQKSTAGDMTIPSLIDGKSVSSIGHSAFEDCSGLTSVTIPEGVKSVGDFAFYGCCGIEFVKFPSTLESIGDKAFADCSGLTSVMIPAGITSLANSSLKKGRVYGGCFSGCTSLTAIEVDSKNSFYSSVDGVLYNKARTKILQCPEGRSGAITIPASATDSFAGSAFAGCTKLTAVNVEKNNRAYVSVDGVLFDKAMKDLVVFPAGRVGSYKIPTGVTNIRYWAFYHCKLESLTIPSSVKDIDREYGSEGFMACVCIKNLTLLTDSDRVLEDLFSIYGLVDSAVCSSDSGWRLSGSKLENVYVRRGDSAQKIKKIVYGWLGKTDLPTVNVWELDTPSLVSVVPGEKVDVDVVLVDYTASGLPSGLKYDKTTGMITGAATKPGEYVVKFTKSGAETEELTIVVGPMPKIDVVPEGDTDDCKVTGMGAYLVGKTVTLKVTAPKGTAFVGFFKDGEPWPNEADCKKTSLAYAMGKEDVSLVAKFEKEKMSVGCVGLSDCSFTAGVAGSPEGIPLEIETQSGVKSVKVEKLPAGMKYDAKKKVITGAPTKAGNGKVVITVTAVSGAVEKKEIDVPVAAMPETAVGTFNGFVANDEQRVGTFSLTTTDAGKLTAKVITAAGTVSFSGTCWDSLEDGVYKVTLTTKKGERLSLTLDSNAAWDADQLSGALTTALILAKGIEIPSQTYLLSAQRNAFGKTWYFAAVGNEQTGWTFAYTMDAKVATLTVTLKADGSTAIAGKLPNGVDAKGKAVSLKVSASGYANVGGMREGAIMTDFAPIVTVNKAKKVLSIHANLWFDRSDDHAEGVGGAEFSE